MSKIVAISDLHLGQSGADGLGQYSLLSTKVPQNLVRALAQRVATFADNEPVTLVVVGDLLDLAIAYAEDAIADLHAMLSAFVGVVRFDEIVYVVGNHDHHLWSLHSEDARILGPLRDGRVPAQGDSIAKGAYQVTRVDGEPFGLLQPIVDRIFGTPAPPTVTIAYPTYSRWLDPDGSRLYVTHGHLFGGLYTDLSSLLRDKLAGLPHAEVAATVNQPVIELIYWLLGEIGGGLGADGLVEAIYTDVQKGDLSKVQGVVARIVQKVVPSHGLLGKILSHWERKLIVDATMSELRKILISPSTPASASADRFADLETTRAGLRAWLGAVGWPIQQPTIALYGHTHVWDDYAIPDSAVHSWNLGTWLVEPDHPAPRTGFLAIDGTDARWVDVTGDA